LPTGPRPRRPAVAPHSATALTLTLTLTLSLTLAVFTPTLTRYEFIEDEESKGAQYKYGNGTYKPEEAVAFVLSYAKQIAEAHAESVIKDCVITVPPYWRHEERTPLNPNPNPSTNAPVAPRLTSVPPRLAALGRPRRPGPKHDPSHDPDSAP